MANPLGHCLPALALQASLAWGLGWPALSPPTFLAGLVAMLPDLAGGPRERQEFHRPRSYLFMGLVLGWAILLMPLMGLVRMESAQALGTAVGLALGSHFLIDGLVEGYPRPILLAAPLPAPWAEVALNTLSLGVLVWIVALAPG